MQTGTGAVLPAGVQPETKRNILGSWKPEAGKGDTHWGLREGGVHSQRAGAMQATTGVWASKMEQGRVRFWKGDLVKNCLLLSGVLLWAWVFAVAFWVFCWVCCFFL